MTRKINHARRPAQGLKFVISAAAVAATLGGWAALSHQTPQSNPVSAAASAPAVVGTPPAWLLEAPAIPTSPPVTELVTNTGTALVAQAPTAAAPVAAPAVVAPQLRAVNAQPAAPPAPVTSTRSSR